MDLAKWQERGKALYIKTVKKIHTRSKKSVSVGNLAGKRTFLSWRSRDRWIQRNVHSIKIWWTHANSPKPFRTTCLELIRCNWYSVNWTISVLGWYLWWGQLLCWHRRITCNALWSLSVTCKGTMDLALFTICE